MGIQDLQKLFEINQQIKQFDKKSIIILSWIQIQKKEKQE